MLRKLLPLVLAMLLVPCLCQAAVNPHTPKIFLHLTYPTTKGILCDNGKTSCVDAVVNGDLYPNGKSYFLYLEVAKGDLLRGILGLQLSIDYDAAAGSGVDVFGWTYCVDAHYEYAGPNGDWPAALSNNLLVWRSDIHCQTGATAVAGYFYLAAYSPDVFRVIPRIVDGYAKVADCNGAESRPLEPGELGRVAFSAGAATPGCNPCVDDCTTSSPHGNPIQPQVVPVQATTWSHIKSLYNPTP
jgi:hypothetical protein